MEDEFNEIKSEINTQLKKLNDLILGLNKKKIICNAQTGVFISDLHGFQFNDDIKKGPPYIYESGTYQGISVNIDANMKWDDTRILDEKQNELLNIKDHFNLTNSMLG